jgi:hypothetical protein
VFAASAIARDDHPGMKNTGLPLLQVHLLRALLRECGYLPDSAARSYWHNHILHRYRAYCPRRKKDGSLETKPNDLSEARQRDLVKKARKHLNVLIRANAGFMEPLERVLRHAYGRVGKRRHDLLGALQRLELGDVVNGSDIPKDSHALNQLAETMRTSESTEPSAFRAFVAASHASTQKQKSKKPQTHPLEPNIPLTNVWARPFPVKRKENMIRKFQAALSAKLQPPLPGDDWARLRDLAAGVIPFKGQPTRRGPEPILPCTFEGRHRNTITARFMRRMWARIFSTCPCMTCDLKTGNWKVLWGDSEKKQTVASRLQWLSERDEAWFEGVDAQGQVLKLSKQQAEV